MTESIKIPRTSVAANAGAHNSIFRGNFLGDTISTEQFNEIDAGTFNDMFIGDYWTINSIQWTICHFDYYWGCGDTDFNKHHVILMPRNSLGNSIWKDGTSPNTNDGYKDSYIRKTTLANYSLPTILNSHAATPRMLYPTIHTSGKAAGWAWVNSQKLELLNETQVCGHQIWSNNGDGDPYQDGIDKWQFNIFRFDPSFANIGVFWWLRSISTAGGVITIADDGQPRDWGISDPWAVRPRLVLIK